MPAGFYSQKCWGLLLLAMKPWGGHLGGAWDPLLFRGNLCSLDIPPNIYPPQVVVGLTHPEFPPVLPVSVWLFL